MGWKYHLTIGKINSICMVIKIKIYTFSKVLLNFHLNFRYIYCFSDSREIGIYTLNVA